MVRASLEAPLVDDGIHNSSKRFSRGIVLTTFALLLATVIALACIFAFSNFDNSRASLETGGQFQDEKSGIIEAEHGVVAADDERCSDIGLDILRAGGHAVDASVATSLCLGVVNPSSSGLGGGAFMLLRSSNGQAQAFNMRETAPQAATEVFLRAYLH